MTFIDDFIEELKTNLEKVLDSNIYLYRFTLSEKKMEDLVSFGKINFISIYPIRIQAKEEIGGANYRAFYGTVKIDFYYSYAYTDDSEKLFLDKMQLILETLQRISVGNNYLLQNDLKFNIDVAMVSNILCHYASTELEIKSFELPDGIYKESLGQTTYKEVEE